MRLWLRWTWPVIAACLWTSLVVTEGKAIDDAKDNAGDAAAEVKVTASTTAHPKVHLTPQIKSNSGKVNTDHAKGKQHHTEPETANTGMHEALEEIGHKGKDGQDHRDKHTGKATTKHDDDAKLKKMGSKEKPHHKHGQWGYFGDTAPEHWGSLPGFGLCSKASMRQSPINIDTLSVQYKDELNDLDIFHKNANGSYHMMIANDGHKVLINTDAEMFVSRGGLKEVFKVAGMHFHWGAEDHKGSEHTLDGKAYPLELHVVTYDNNNYGSVHDALNGEDSLAVLGTFFQITQKDNPSLEPIISTFDTIRSPTKEMKTIPMVPLTDLLPRKRESYYRYKGSLTTPGCFQNVIWTVFDTTAPISRRQMDKFRSLHRSVAGEPLVDNFRPVQALYNRTVHASFYPKRKVARYVTPKEVKGQASVFKMANLWVISLLVLSMSVTL